MQYEHQDYVYNLGNDFKATNPETATSEFLKREFPQILESETKPHHALFIPDTFIYGDIAKKVSISLFFFNEPPSFGIASCVGTTVNVKTSRGK